MSTAEVRITARHLFRALLRAATYLPDEFAQTYIHNYIIRRFRNASKITPARLRDARGSLNTLRRAANGEIKPLTSVLHQAYGRAGRRRRELIVAMQRAEAKPLLSSEAAAEKTIIEDLSRDDNIKTSHPVFHTFIRSQAANHPPETSRVKIRHLQPQIPKESIWGRPIALRRQQNMRHEFWASTLNKLLPPLPELEWNRLRDLATGAIPFKGPPPRRARRCASEDEFEPLLKISYLKAPIRDAARRSKDVGQQTMNSHKINGRFMRRIWASVWNLTPMMSYEAETKTWTVIWGGGRSAASNGQTGSAGRADLELFEGVDMLAQGPKRSGPRSPKPAAPPDIKAS